MFEGRENGENRSLVAIAEKVRRVSMGFDDGLSNRNSHIDLLREIALIAPDASRNGMNGIQFEIQFQHIPPRFAQESQLPPFRMLGHQSAKISVTHPPLARHPRNLKFR